MTLIQICVLPIVSGGGNLDTDNLTVHTGDCDEGNSNILLIAVEKIPLPQN